MSHERSIVRPVRGRRPPALGPLAFMVATEPDLHRLNRRMALPDCRSLYLSRIFYDASRPDKACLVGPLVGAPYAAMVLETLRVWGVHTIVFFGWCGSIHTELATGDIIIPRKAIVDEGTSPHYGVATGDTTSCDDPFANILANRLRSAQLPFGETTVWTTDAIFRETPTKLRRHRDRGARAVDMEASALFSVARHHAMPAAAILLVSDELATFTWRPGFKDARFKDARRRICEFLANTPLELR